MKIINNIHELITTISEVFNVVIPMFIIVSLSYIFIESWALWVFIIWALIASGDRLFKLLNQNENN